MRIAGTQFTLKDRAFEIYVSGCNIHCKGCHNPELQSFDYGEDFTEEIYNKIVSKINEAGVLVEEIRILGGEPLDSGNDLYNLVLNLNSYFPYKKIVLFTGYNLDYLKEYKPSVFNLFDKIKYGKYDETLRTEGEELASSNQKWWIK